MSRKAASRMLDLNHPQTEHIFAAALLEDAVLECARRIVSAQPFERPELLALCERFTAHELCLPAFTRLESDEGFGTVWIRQRGQTAPGPTRLAPEIFSLKGRSQIKFNLKRISQRPGLSVASGAQTGALWLRCV